MIDLIKKHAYKNYLRDKFHPPTVNNNLLWCTLCLFRKKTNKIKLLMTSSLALFLSACKNDDHSEKSVSKDFTNSGDQGKISLGSSTANSLQMISSETLGMDPFRKSEFSKYQGEGFTAVVIDTGIDLNHSAFSDDLDGNGISDRIVYTQDFSTDGDGTADDVHGHGTHVASIIASSDPSYLGVAPKASIIALQTLSNSGQGRKGDIEDALKWVIDNASSLNITAVNMSLGAGNNSNKIEPDTTMGDELKVLNDMGVIVVVAAGNDYYKYQSPGLGSPAHDENVIPVGAVWQDNIGRYAWGGPKDFRTDADRVVSFSQRSTEHKTVFAEGALILGAKPGGGTHSEGGTSQAAPFVAGTALIAQEIAEDLLGRRLTPNEFHDLLLESATTIYDGDDERDNVTNLNTELPRVDMLALAYKIQNLAENQPVKADDDFGNDQTTSAALEINKDIKGVLETGTDQDWFIIEMDPSLSYTVEVRASKTETDILSDPFVTLYDQLGNVLISDDDGGVGKNSLIEFTPQSKADFYLAVSSYGTEVSGAYTIAATSKLRTKADDHSGEGSTNSNIIISDDTLSGHAFGSIEVNGDLDWHKVKIQNNFLHSINLTQYGDAALGDPFLRIFNEGGDLISSNDDGGLGKNARLQFKPDIENEYFYIEASSTANSFTGDYKIDVSVFDPSKDISSDLATTKTAILEETFKSTIDFDGDRDWIKLDLQGGKVYDLLVSGDGLSTALEDPYIKLMHGNGQLLFENDDLDGLNSGFENFSVVNTGSYFLSVASYGDYGTGDYRVALKGITDDPNDIPGDISTQFTIAENETLNGNLEKLGDRDWFGLQLDEYSTYSFEFFGSGTTPLDDPILQVYNSNSSLIAEDDDGGQFSNSRLIFTTEAAGSYFLAAGAYGDSFKGTYTISMVKLDVADDYLGSAETTIFLKEGVPITGSIQTAGDQDFFKFITNIGAIYEFSLVGDVNSDNELKDPFLAIIDSEGEYLALNDNWGNTLDAKATILSSTSGTIFVAASSLSEENNPTGNYVLNVKALEVGIDDDHLGDISTTSRINISEVADGEIGVFDEADFFVVEVAEGEAYSFRVGGLSSEFGTLPDSEITLFDANGNWLFYNDDGDIGKDSFIYSFTPEYSGDLFVSVEGFNFENDRGTYKLLVENSEPIIDDHGNSADAASVLAVGEPKSGELEFGDTYDVFKVSLEPNQVYDVYIATDKEENGEAFDSYLEIYSGTDLETQSDFELISFNDDAADFNGSFIEEFTSINKDDYYLVVSGYDQSDRGHYEIGVVNRRAFNAEDDFGQSVTTNGSVTVGDKVSGILEEKYDTDWVKTYLSEGKKYQFSFNEPNSENEIISQPVIALRDYNGNLLSYGESEFAALASYSGDYFVEVMSGDYGLGLWSVSLDIIT